MNTFFKLNQCCCYLQLHKTNTAILLKIEPAPKCNESPRTDDVSVVEFGYSAERRYSNLCSQKAKDLDSYYLFKKFKLQLYRLKDVTIYHVKAYRAESMCRPCYLNQKLCQSKLSSVLVVLFPQRNLRILNILHLTKTCASVNALFQMGEQFLLLLITVLTRMMSLKML